MITGSRPSGTIPARSPTATVTLLSARAPSRGSPAGRTRPPARPGSWRSAARHCHLLAERAGLSLTPAIAPRSASARCASRLRTRRLRVSGRAHAAAEQELARLQARPVILRWWRRGSELLRLISGAIVGRPLDADRRVRASDALSGVPRPRPWWGPYCARRHCASRELSPYAVSPHRAQQLLDRLGQIGRWRRLRRLLDRLGHHARLTTTARAVRRAPSRRLSWTMPIEAAARSLPRRTRDARARRSRP